MAALRLAKKTNASAAITLVNATDTFNERVRNHQWAAGQRVGEHPLADVLRGTRSHLLHGTVTALHLAGRRITVQTETGQRDMGYDYLVYTLGSHVRTADVPGVCDHAYTLDYRSAIAQLPSAISDKRASRWIVCCRPNITQVLSMWLTKRFGWFMAKLILDARQDFLSWVAEVVNSISYMIVLLLSYCVGD
jgi:hypothetical protein